MKNINTTICYATLCIVNINMTSLDTCFLNNNNNTKYYILYIYIYIYKYIYNKHKNKKPFRDIYERQLIIKIIKIDK